jgi:uncharacterized protein involved in exopolysaccharide biosynthesis
VNLESKRAGNHAGAVALREQIEQTQHDHEAAERRLLDFKVDNNMVSEQNKFQIQSAAVGAVTGAQIDAGIKRIEAENKYRTISQWYQANDFTLPLPADLAGTTQLDELYQQIVKKRIEQASLLARYREQHPKVETVNAELETLKRQFDYEVRNAMELWRRRAKLYGDVGRDQKDNLKSQKDNIIHENERDWKYSVLARNVEVKEEIYKSLLQRLGEVNVMSSIVKNNARIIERGKAVGFPIQPNWRFNLLVGLVFGLGVAIAAVFFLEYLDKTLKTPDDVARYLALPVLAVVPLARQEMLRAPYATPQIESGSSDASAA